MLLKYETCKLSVSQHFYIIQNDLSQNGVDQNDYSPSHDVDLLTPSISKYQPQIIRDTLKRDAIMQKESKTSQVCVTGNRSPHDQFDIYHTQHLLQTLEEDEK